MDTHEPNDGVRRTGRELALKARKSRRNQRSSAHLWHSRDRGDPRARPRVQKVAKKELPARRMTACTISINWRKCIAVQMHSKQIGQPCLSRCITMPKMRGLRPSHVHSMSMAKSQHQEQRQQRRAFRPSRHTFRAGARVGQVAWHKRAEWICNSENTRTIVLCSYLACYWSCPWVSGELWGCQGSYLQIFTDLQILGGSQPGGGGADAQPRIKLPPAGPYM